MGVRQVTAQFIMGKGEEKGIEQLLLHAYGESFGVSAILTISDLENRRMGGPQVPVPQVV